MKRLLSVLLAVFLMTGIVTGCGEAEKSSNEGTDKSSNNENAGKRVLYGDVDWSKVVELGDYKNLPVDTKSDTFNIFYEDTLKKDVEDNSFYNEATLTEGKVQNGDVANIDYTGKKDGVAFEGGTAQAHDLEIGSGSFIPGFEDGLIGVSVGQTVDLNLTFPENYGKEELNGAAVVFTVKVNSIKRKTELKPSEYFSELGFKSVSEYYKDARKRAVEDYLLETIIKNSKVKEYPKAELEIIYNQSKVSIETTLKQQYGIGIEDYLQAVGQSEEVFKAGITEEIKAEMEIQMVLYNIFDIEGLKFSQKEIDAQVDKLVKKVNNSSVTAETVKSVFGDYYFEQAVVKSKVADFVYKNAKLN